MMLDPKDKQTDEDKMIHKLTLHKKMIDVANIAWAENIPENEFINLESLDV